MKKVCSDLDACEKSYLILVDSSVWVDFFISCPGHAGAQLRRMISASEPFALTGVVVAEVSQRLTRDAGRIEQFLAQWDLLEPRGLATYREAAAIYRAARRKGVSLTTINSLIAATALEHGWLFSPSTRTRPHHSAGALSFLMRDAGAGP